MGRDLVDVQEKYLRQLCNCKHIFNTEYGQLVLKFEKENFCHLIGIHYTYSNVKGIYGWNQIEDGYITYKTIRAFNKSSYEILVQRITVLENCERIFETCNYIKINKGGNGKLACDFFIYDSIKKKFLVLAIVIDKSNFNYCVAVSCLSYYTNDSNSLKYLGLAKGFEKYEYMKVDKDDSRCNDSSIIKLIYPLHSNK